jgi:hypothetical protein
MWRQACDPRTGSVGSRATRRAGDCRGALHRAETIQVQDTVSKRPPRRHQPDTRHRQPHNPTPTQLSTGGWNGVGHHMGVRSTHGPEGRGSARGAAHRRGARESMYRYSQLHTTCQPEGRHAFIMERPPSQPWRARPRACLVLGATLISGRPFGRQKGIVCARPSSFSPPRYVRAHCVEGGGRDTRPNVTSSAVRSGSSCGAGCTCGGRGSNGKSGSRCSGCGHRPGRRRRRAAGGHGAGSNGRSARPIRLLTA